ncbi:unnamed protein product [Didymodactylos carnosus]|uniref:Uncharacterized protein n=1 Tax=Didymodactylos carnosus TaxID=1234261 RepID=A0A815G4Z5_9BILA|nr:unnamed protein product [Didymodactylos carnosus]CAF4190801.1 unnamed protein product [Didymodactylos carnosus]
MASYSVVSRADSSSTTDRAETKVLKQFFENLVTNSKNNWSACCQLYKQTISDKIQTTSNFNRHLRRAHASEYTQWLNSKYAKPSQPNIDDIFTTKIKYDDRHERQKAISNSIIQDLIGDMRMPLNIVERTGFKNFMNKLDPKYSIISHRIITRDRIPKMYDAMLKKLKVICNNVSITLDLWSDRRLRSYMGVTLHTIIDKQNKSYLLSFLPLAGRHTGENLISEFEKILQFYSIQKTLVRLVTDNASNMIKAFDKLILPGFEEYFKEENEEVESNRKSGSDKINDDLNEVIDEALMTIDFKRIPCFAHTLQLVVDDGIKNSAAVKSSLTKIAKIAKFSHTRTVFAERLEILKATIPSNTNIRWNSQFHTITKVVQIDIDKLNIILYELNKSQLMLTQRNKIIIDEFISLFYLFNEATIQTQAENSPTISLVGPCLLSILNDLEHEQGKLIYN